MTKSHPGMTLYFDDLKGLAPLDNAQLGELIRALAAYAQEDCAPAFDDPTLSLAFSMLRVRIDREKAHAEEVSARRAEAARKSRASKQASSEQLQHLLLTVNPTEAKKETVNPAGAGDVAPARAGTDSSEQLQHLLLTVNPTAAKKEIVNPTGAGDVTHARAGETASEQMQHLLLTVNPTEAEKEIVNPTGAGDVAHARATAANDSAKETGFDSVRSAHRSQGDLGGFALSLKDGEKDVDGAYEPRKENVRFTPPAPDDVRAYAGEMGYDGFDAESFVNYYASNGWKVGRNPMKDWRAAVRRWHDRDRPKVQEKVYRDFDPLKDW